MRFVLFVVLIFSISQAQNLHLYAGPSHKTYLGCLNCNSYDSNSIWNEYGMYGSQYNSNSIWNEYGQYGGAYSLYSPFNEYTQTPPIIVDKNGNSYGYLTANKYKLNRANNDFTNFIVENWEDIINNFSEVVYKLGL